jgi:hypothetical protein
VPAKGNVQKILIGPDEGARLPVLGITHKVTAEHFGGALTSIEGRIPPGDMIPPHTHTCEDERTVRQHSRPIRFNARLTNAGIERVEVASS